MKLKDKQKCTHCGRLTNNYDVIMGRVCEVCAKTLAEQFIPSKIGILEEKQNERNDRR